MKVIKIKKDGKGNSGLPKTRENAMSAGKTWVGDNYNIIKDNAGNVLGYSSADGMRAFRIQYKPKEGMWRANFKRILWLIIHTLIQGSIVHN